ncbi:MAG: MBL fold metallo-hydrolase [Deltaproteobacteria bacterium]|nr:MBL fold metallo-hydrolase [Deltaproteobacteria bacterium]
MSLTRRSLLGLMAASPALSSSSSSSSSSSGQRLLFVRHSTVLVEAGGLRLLFDPALAPGFGAQGVLREAEEGEARSPSSLGRIDLVLISSGEPGSFDVDTIRRLDVRRARFLVPDDGVRKRLAQLGHARVRVLKAGDVVDVGGLRVTASPAQGVLGDAIGFHVASDGGPGLWHTGPIPPLEVDAQVMSFAADHEAAVVCGCCSGLGLSSSGPPWFAGVDDALALARLARARVLMPVARGVVPAGLFSLVLSAPPPTRPVTTSRDPRVEEPVMGTWYRFRA